MDPYLMAFLVILPGLVVGICGAISIFAMLYCGKK